MSSSLVVLHWMHGTLYTSAGQVFDRDVTLDDAGMLAGTLSQEGPQDVVIRRGRP